MSENTKNNKPEERTISFGDGKVFKITPDIKTIQVADGKTIQLEDGRTINFEIGKTVKVQAEGTPVPQEIKRTVVNVEDGRVINVIPEGDVQLREENVQEILTAVPSWMIRWGNTLFCSLILMLLFIAWFVKYPEVVSAPVTVLNKFPNQKITLEPSTPISDVLVSQGDAVQKGEVLVVIQNTANYKDVLLLQSLLDSIPLNSKTFYFPFHQLPALALGDIQATFAQFEDSYLLYQRNKEKIERTKKQIYQPSGYFADSKSTEEVQLFRQVIQDFQKLKTQVHQWDQKYLIKSALDGAVQSINLTQKRNASSNDPLMVIQPSQPPVYVAQLEVPLLNSGKIKPAQTVLLKLNNYPDMEFGMLEGVVSQTKNKTIDNGKGYLVEASLPQQLVTSYNKEIDFKDNLQGTAEIIIEHSRLLERFFSSIH